MIWLLVPLVVLCVFYPLTHLIMWSIIGRRYSLPFRWKVLLIGPKAYDNSEWVFKR